MNRLSEAIERGVPLVVLSPHLDDAVFSCGALLIHAAEHTAVTVATLFTEAHPPPYTLSARRSLHLAGAAGDAEALYRQRRAEDRAALAPLGIRCVHAGLTDALFRLRSRPGGRGRWRHLLPELEHMYPLYRLNVISGRIAPGDVGALHGVRDVIQRLACPGRELVLAPLGVGGHVDHVLVRTAAEHSGARVAYYSDFPYNLRSPAIPSFVRHNGLVEERWSERLDAKAELVSAYQTQAGTLFPGGRVPRVPEVFFLSDAADSLAPAVTG
jgi:LmbE family N-acetylglucosaminyl deacetylase